MTFVFDGTPSSGGPRWRTWRDTPEFSAPAETPVFDAAVVAANPSDAFWAFAAWVVLS